MRSQLTSRQDQLLRVYQRIVCSISLGMELCVLMVIIFPYDLYVDSDISVFADLRMLFWNITVCCPVSLNCAGVVRALLPVRRRGGIYRSMRAFSILGAMCLSLIPPIIVVNALLDRHLSMRTNIMLYALLLFFVGVLYRFVEYSKTARVQRIQFFRCW